MMRSIEHRLMQIAALLPILLRAASCGPKDAPSIGITLPSGVDFPCDLTDDMVGRQFKVGGEITFVDDSDPAGRFADREYEGCRVGITVDIQRWREWSPEEQAAFKLGTQVVVQGRLGPFPAFGNPDEGHVCGHWFNRGGIPKFLIDGHDAARRTLPLDKEQAYMVAKVDSFARRVAMRVTNREAV